MLAACGYYVAAAALAVRDGKLIEFPAPPPPLAASPPPTAPASVPAPPPTPRSLFAEDLLIGNILFAWSFAFYTPALAVLALDTYLTLSDVSRVTGGPAGTPGPWNETSVLLGSFLASLALMGLASALLVTAAGPAAGTAIAATGGAGLLLGVACVTYMVRRERCCVRAHAVCSSRSRGMLMPSPPTTQLPLLSNPPHLQVRMQWRDFHNKTGMFLDPFAPDGGGIGIEEGAGAGMGVRFPSRGGGGGGGGGGVGFFYAGESGAGSSFGHDDWGGSGETAPLLHSRRGGRGGTAGGGRVRAGTPQPGGGRGGAAGGERGATAAGGGGSKGGGCFACFSSCPSGGA